MNWWEWWLSGIATGAFGIMCTLILVMRYMMMHLDKFGPIAMKKFQERAISRMAKK